MSDVMMPLLDRVGYMLCEQFGLPPDAMMAMTVGHGGATTYTMPAWKFYRAKFIAGLLEIRMPTEAMLRARGADSTQDFTRMIDHLIEEARKP